MRDVFIVNIGSELTKGEIANTNAAYIASELNLRGFVIRAIYTLPDDSEICISHLATLLQREGIFIFTGGLGGTRDDITRRIVATALDRDLEYDTKKVELLERYYREKSRDFIEADRMQASFPAGGMLLDNIVGLAYGFYLHENGRYIFSLPGVPREMKAMFDSQVLKILDEQNLVHPGHSHEMIRFSDVSEYALDRQIEKILRKFPGVEYGTRASYGIIRVLIDSLDVDIEPAVQKIIHELEPFYINRGTRELPQLLADTLKKKHLTVATAESCTGGLLSKVLTDIPGSSDYFLGGVVAYSNELKMKFLTVSEETLKRFGAVSSQTAEEMAAGAAQNTGSDIAVSITGIAGPGGGTDEKSVGTVFICRALKDAGTHVDMFHFKGDRETIRMMSTNKALFLTYRDIQGRLKE